MPSPARRANVQAAATALATFSGAGTAYLVAANNGALYIVFVELVSNDVMFIKSVDGGLTWSDTKTVFAGTATAVAVWYDRWSGISGDLIHCAYQESGTDDTLYRTINTGSSDALSTQTVIFAGATTAAGGQLSITRARGGNVYCRTCIDAGAEGGFFRLSNADVPNGAWASRTINEALATQDQMILMPGFAADNQDIIGIFWDASADEISRQLYDDSANSWAETSIAGSMVDLVATTAFPNFAAFPDLTNSRVVLVAWTQANTVNADLRCWTVTEAAITEVTNVVLNSGGNQGLCAIAIDTTTGYWYVTYTGKSDGTESFPGAANLYYKVSQDTGTTWGSETALTSIVISTLAGIFGPARWSPTTSGPYAAVSGSGLNQGALKISVDRTVPQASLILGV